MVVGVYGGEIPKVIVQLPDGSRARIPQKWTDYIQPFGNHTNSNNEHLLDLNCLFKLVKMIERLKKDGNF